jgi:HAD superfamily hydrolase (TIGR01549 family)
MPRDRNFLVFDLDGTIFASTPFYFAILEKVFAKNGLQLSEAEKALAAGLSARKFLSTKLSADATSEALEFMNQQSTIDIEHIQMFEGLSCLLTTLLNRGKRLAAWTSRDHGSATLLLRKHQLDKYFDVIVTGDCVENHKPDPEGLQRIAGHFACSVSDLVMIGDHDVDIAAAQSAGALPIRANWHGFRDGQNCHLGAETIHSVRELSEKLL